MASMTPSFALDGSYRRFNRVVIAGSPLRLFRLTAGGQRAIEAIEQHQPLPSGHTKLTDRLVDAGAIHPIPAESSFTAADVTIVVPAFNARPPETRDDSELIIVDEYILRLNVSMDEPFVVHV